MNPENWDGETPSPHDSFAKIFHVIEQAEHRIHETNLIAARIAKSGFLVRTMLVGPVIATVPRAHANGTALPPLVMHSAIYAPLGLGVLTSWEPKAGQGKPWRIRRAKRVQFFHCYDSCPYLWRYILVKQHRKHLGQLIVAMLGVLGRQLKRFLNTGEGSMRKKHQPDNPSARMVHEAAVNRLASLLAKLVAIRHLNNEARKRRQGGADTEKR